MKVDKQKIEQEFMAAYEEHSDAIFRYCYFQTSNREVALDLSQDTFTKTWQYIADGKEVDNIRAFLYRVAKNAIIDWRRKKKSSSLDALLDEGFDYEDDLDAMERQETAFEAEQAKEALEDLKDSYKEVLTMRYMDGLSVKDIAEKLGATENTISVRIHRGLQKLKRHLTRTTLNNMEDKFEQLKKKAEGIRMTEAEKSLMRSRIQETMEHFPIRESAPTARPVKSPFNFVMFARSVAFVLVGFIAGGGGLAFASEQALPGDALYTIKTDITEEVVAALQTTPEAKIAWEEKRIKRRAAEITNLQKKGQFKEEKARIAVKKLEESNTRVNKELTKLSEDLSFDGVVFTPRPRIEVSSSAAAPVAPREILPQAEVTAPERILSSRKPLGVTAELGVSSSALVETEEVKEEIEIKEEDEPETLDVSAAVTQVKAQQEDFAMDVIEKMELEIDKLIADKKVDDQIVSKLKSLIEIAQKAHEAEDTKKLYQTIREIKTILVKISQN